MSQVYARAMRQEVGLIDIFAHEEFSDFGTEKNSQKNNDRVQLKPRRLVFERDVVATESLSYAMLGQAREEIRELNAAQAKDCEQLRCVSEEYAADLARVEYVLTHQGMLDAQLRDVCEQMSVYRDALDAESVSIYANLAVIMADKRAELAQLAIAFEDYRQDAQYSLEAMDVVEKSLLLRELELSAVLCRVDAFENELIGGPIFESLCKKRRQ